MRYLYLDVVSDILTKNPFSKACYVCIYKKRITFDMYTYYHYSIHAHAMGYYPMNLRHFAFNTTYIQ